MNDKVKQRLKYIFKQKIDLWRRRQSKWGRVSNIQAEVRISIIFTIDYLSCARHGAKHFITIDHTSHNDFERYMILFTDISKEADP